MTISADAVVIGGGVMGCSILYNLAVRGVKNAVLLERDLLGSGSTGRSSGAVRMHYSNEVHARMAWESLRIFQNFDDIVGGECGFTQTGYLVFSGDDDVDAFRSNVAMQQSVGIQTGIIGRSDAQE
ncbi:MAG TPA: FAD-binding oxidoreductase, partial [Dehalococcoidia bacterium]|nr:FAD-binding oxidoreductase [Dehalococcoidia bacterium]